jgi:hypothetical protein
MRLPLDKFLEKLSVGHTLTAYETHPWFIYDETQGINASAEVRMGPGGDDLEAEIQFLYDNPPQIQAPSSSKTDEDRSKDEGDEGEDDSGFPPKFGGMFSGGRQQVLWLKARPVVPTEWTITDLRIKGKDYVNAFGDWDVKACSFFTACTQAMMMNELPDVDALIEEHMKDDDFWGGGKRGKIGKKAPGIKPAQLLGLKR